VTEILIFAALLGFAGICLGLLARRANSGDGALTAAIDAVLPQLQCAKCGYPGCRPYAEALAKNEAAIDLCPPGGKAVMDALADITGVAAPAIAPLFSPPQTALIREEECVGCGLCLDACPVDAIVGAPGFAYTVMAAQCTGCELCVSPCPTDCITLAPRKAEEKKPPPPLSAPCIRCGACDAVCPVNISPLSLYAICADSEKSSQPPARGVRGCIECGACDAVCPADIPLAAIFRFAKGRLRAAAADARQAAAAKAAFEARQIRLAKNRAAQIREMESASAADAVAAALSRISRPAQKKGQ
jgi:electron transport complex protein RnfB